MKFKNKSLIFILSLLLVIFVFIISGLMVTLDLNFYKENFVKNNVYANFDNSSYVDEISANLINYFNYDEDLLEVYDQDERSHLQDVRWLIIYLEIFSALVFLILILIFFKYRYNYLVFMVGFVIILLFIILLYIFNYFDFLTLFTFFHKPFFDEGTYSFTNDSLLIKLFPLEFFIFAFEKILLYSFFIALGFFALSIYLRKTNK